MSVPTLNALASIFAPTPATNHLMVMGGLMATWCAASNSMNTTKRFHINGFNASWSMKNLGKHLSSAAKFARGGSTNNKTHAGLYGTYHRPARGMFVSRHTPRSPPALVPNA